MPTTIESLDALADATAAARTFRVALEEARVVAAAAEVAFLRAEQRLVDLARQVGGCGPADDVVLGSQHFIPHDQPETAVRVIDDAEADLTPAPVVLAGNPEPVLAEMRKRVAEDGACPSVPAEEVYATVAAALEKPGVADTLVERIESTDLVGPEPAAEVPTWRKLTLEAAGYMAGDDAFEEEVCAALVEAGVRTCGELADRLLAGETFGLKLIDLSPVHDAIELISADDEKPIRFGPDEEEPADDLPPLAVGDVIRTSYGTGPYVVTDVSKDGVRGGRKWSLTLADANPGKGSKHGTSWINGVELQPDGRITSLEGKDELFVVPNGQPHGPDYFDWCRDAGMVRENGNKELQLKWMRGEAAPAAGTFTPTPESVPPAKKPKKSGAKVTKVELANGPATIVSHPDADLGDLAPASNDGARPAVTLLSELDNFPDAVFDKLFHVGITSLETLMERMEEATQLLGDMPVRNKLVTFLVNAGLKMNHAQNGAAAVCDHLAKKSAPEPGPVQKPAAPAKPYGWSILYLTTDGQELRCHYTGTEAKARGRAMKRPKAKHILTCEPLTEREYTASFGRGGM